MNPKKQFFLLQVNKYGSDQILNQGMYEHLDWRINRKDIAHGEVKVGDLILVYFTSTAPLFKKILKMIYVVSAVKKDNTKFYLKNWKELNGLSYGMIQNLFKKNQLSDEFKNCGLQGYNIFRVTKKDFDKILEIDEKSTLNINLSRDKVKFYQSLENTENLLSEGETFSRDAEKNPSKKPKSKKQLEKEIKQLNEEIKKRKPKQKSVKTDKFRYVRIKNMVNKLKDLHKKCMICKQDHFEMQNGSLYSEVSHIIPFNVSHKDNEENLTVLCPTCHKKFDNARYFDRKKLYERLCENFPHKKFERPPFMAK